MITAVHEDWLACAASVSGLEALNDWEWLSCLQPQQPKNVSFKYPLVTSCRYRPRETLEERSQLYFSSDEIRVMKAQNRARRLEEEKARALDQKIMGPSALQPKFEAIHLSRGNVKVMYAVPTRRQKR